MSVSPRFEMYYFYVLLLLYTIWLVIFTRDLFLCFSRVQEPFTKIKTAKFCCPHAKQVNHISIRPTSNYLAVLTPTEAFQCVVHVFDGYHSSHPENQSAT